ncbi:replicative DNA helicase [Caldicellulosiruptor saccharolyticus DSM 8903]|uniref:Replicative DNA helicase n=1 Tax=Caldicellulosiruptor saccharolyticus (strain ATCC 43494 / DSM 8903 / Tp8T 6331) TaxID=351627 RepID=A4XJI1_CALS8|nr:MULTISPECIES: replicative DNA helicase [Caldicellulosiruptor]ABP67066.1 replicative DNA helicase [Caldicellulosiruptor saccharolyticus DSM 8903]
MEPDILQSHSEMPESREAEEAVVGAMLLDKEVISDITEILTEDDFATPQLKEVFAAIMDLFEEGKPIDVITVSERLRERGSFEAVGGSEYLTNLVINTPTSANATYYARIVEEKSLLRKLINSSMKIIEKCKSQTERVEDIVDFAEKTIFNVISHKSSRDFSHLKEILIETYNKIEELYLRKSHIIGVPTGFAEFDRMTAGLQPSDLILIAARPAMGKTSFALNIVQHAALRAGVPVAIFSLEMSKEQLVTRMICSEAMIDSHKLRTGNLEDEEWKKFAKALALLSNAPIYIDDTPAITVSEMRAKCRRLKLKEKGLGLVMVDYLQLMTARGRFESKQQEIAEISRSLKALARELNVPVLALSQLSRAPETRADHRPILSDLRESGAIEQDADIVAFLYRDEYYNPDTDKKHIAELIIAKHRNGPTGTIELLFLDKHTKFKDLEKNRV